MKNGKYINSNGGIYWYQKNKLHREDGPAFQSSEKSIWYFEDERHRENGPAYEEINGYQEWWFYGKTHRVDGPAILYPNGDKEYWLNDIQYSEYEFKYVHTKLGLKEDLEKHLKQCKTSTQLKV